MMEPESEQGMEPMDRGEPQPTGLENEFKTVPGVHAPDPVSEPIPTQKLSLSFSLSLSLSLSTTK